MLDQFLKHLNPVLVGINLMLPMQWFVQKEGSRLSGTMRFDLTANLFTEVCHDVETEPKLQVINGERVSFRTANMEDGAQLDVKACGFWGNSMQCAFSDVRVFHPNAQSNQLSNLTAIYSKHEAEKKRVYGQRVREVEQASFTPLVFSSAGGMGREAAVVYKRITSLISSKRNCHYSHTIAWIRCRLSFALLRSSIICIRGARSHLRHAVMSGDNTEMVRVESRLSH